MVDQFYKMNASVVGQQEERQFEDYNLVIKSVGYLSYLLRSRKVALRGPADEYEDLATEEWGWRRNSSGELEMPVSSIGTVHIPISGDNRVILNAKAFHTALTNHTKDHVPAYRRWITEMQNAGLVPVSHTQGVEKVIVLRPDRMPTLFTLREDLRDGQSSMTPAESDAF